MTKQEEQFRPYAAPANIVAVLNRARTRNLPETINNDFLRITGVPEAAWYRVMQTLQFLGLVHEDGRPSDTFEALAGATENQYRELLASTIQEAYSKEFSVIDPGQDSQPRIIDAFRPYKPRSQTARIVMLFLGLCHEAGIPVLEAPRERSMAERKARQPKSISGRRSRQIAEEKKQGVGTITSPLPTGVIFGVTDDDIGALSEGEFDEVWAALGKVARARARVKKEAMREKASTEETREEENEH